MIGAANVQEAIKLMTEHKIDFVLSDINLGENQPDGFEFIKHVRTKDTALPFYFMSGYQASELRSKALSEGATGYLQTPVSKDELMVLVK